MAKRISMRADFCHLCTAVFRS